MSEKNLKVLITGGNRGLGRKMAENLVQQGHEVYVLGRSDRSEIDQPLISILADYIKCDLSKISEINECFKSLISQVDRIDVLINNAAIRQFTKKFEEFQVGEIEYNIDVDFVAPVVLSNLCLQVMKRNKFGRIINISSIGASKIFTAGSLYCSSKNALIVFSETLSKELSGLKGAVTVNTICPDSFSKVDGTPLKHYRQITDSVLVSVNRIIQTEANGQVINSFTFKHKLRESLRLIKRSLKMLIS